jgi:arylsulfatase A
MSATRRLIAAAAALLLFACASSASKPSSSIPNPQSKIQNNRPNIVLIMADDLGYETLGCNGGQSYATPNLDRLAAQGMRFENAFCTPLCGPTRQMLMTGRYGFRTGQVWGTLPASEVTFAHVLKDAGYATAVAGKWQLCKFPKDGDMPTRAGFDAHCLWTWDYNGKKPSRYWDPVIWQDGKLLEGVKGKYGPDLYCDYLVDFIRKNKDRPFFVYYSMALVHDPIEPTPDHPDRPKGAQRYADTVAYLDKLAGKIVSTIDELGLGNNTLILFTGDNGTSSGHTTQFRGRPFKGGKSQMNDAGAHVPFIARWTGTVPAGREVDDLLDQSDVLPTLAELAGAKLPADRRIDGRSQAALLTGRGRSPREWIYFQLWDQHAVRDKRFGMLGDGTLYDAANDPYWKTPVAPDAGPEAAAAHAHLAAALKTLRADPEWRVFKRDKSVE